MTDKVSAKQAGVILVLSVISLKFLVFPSVFAKYAFRDVYIPILFGLVLDFLFTVLLVKAMIKNPNLTFFQLLNKSLGKVFSKIVLSLLFVYLFVKGIIIVKETHNYFNETLFESINWLLFIVPFFLIMAFFMVKNFKVISRSAEFFSLVMLFGVLFTIFNPITEIDFSNLLPFFEFGVGGIFKSFFYSSFAFGDFFVLFLLMGKIEVNNKTEKTILKHLVFADVVVFLFYIVFSAIFGKLGLNHSQAISELIMFTSTKNSTGTLNWLNIMIWIIILIFEAGVTFASCSQILKEILGLKSIKVATFWVVLLMISSVLYLYLSLIKIINIVTSVPFVVYAISMQVAMPILCLVLFKVNKISNVEMLENNFKTPFVKFEETNLNGKTINQHFSNINKPKKSRRFVWLKKY